MAMTVVEEKWEQLWYWDSVIWPAPPWGKYQKDQLEPEIAVACTSGTNDGGGENGSGCLKGRVKEEEQQQQQQQQEGQPHQPLGLYERRHRRSLSDDMRLDMSKVLTTKREGPSSLDSTQKTALQPHGIKEWQPINNHKVPKLETIASGKEFKELSQAKMVPKVQQAAPRQREQKRGTKSLTDLEYDELKGFSELGFTFSEDDLTPRVVQVLPALQRLGKQGPTSESSHNVSRPYLSEAWLVRKPAAPVVNWHIPPPRMQGVDMKEHLKFWAHAVASNVKMEC